MSRLVPGRDTGAGAEGQRVPEVLRFLSGQPIRAVDWRDVALAANLAYVCDGAGVALSTGWLGGGLPLGAGDVLRMRIPLPSPLHTRVRIRAWAQGGAGDELSISSATAGPVALPVTSASIQRHPAPGSDVILDAAADVVDDPDAGRYVDVAVECLGVAVLIEDLALDVLEPGAPALYPALDSALPAGIVGLSSGSTLPLVAADTLDFDAERPLRSGALWRLRGIQTHTYDRRRILYSWASWEGAGMQPPRHRFVLRAPVRSGMRLTLAAHVEAGGAQEVAAVLEMGVPDGSFERLMLRIGIGATDPAGWYMQTVDIGSAPIDFPQAAQGAGAVALAAVRAGGARPYSTGGQGRAGQQLGTEREVSALAVWLG